MVLNSGLLTGRRRIRPASSGPRRNYVNLYDFFLGKLLKKYVCSLVSRCCGERELVRARMEAVSKAE